MILVLQMCKSGSGTIGEYILGEIHYEYSHTTNCQKQTNSFWSLREGGLFMNQNRVDSLLF